ncbi:MAG: DNA double-strand break repair nuclease NurA, partial [Anaerolineales bacterium]|nr:DNA double-strand break repair nuclease NurA [Anaerolineales bacterium]MDW8446987.1 DNA double-strand break repair nuclease NurA [Anaerolineales bacterium]
MTINYRQLYPQIRRLADQVANSALERSERRQRALEVLERVGSELEFLRDKVEQAVRQEGWSLRYAKPLDASLNTRYSSSESGAVVNLAAADGSQLLPDRHAELYFGLIHVGGVTLPQFSSLLPREHSRSEFWYAEAEDFSESLFNFRRDVLERKMLSEISLTLDPPVLALADGPLELWLDYRFSEEGKREWRRLLEEYLDVLRTFHERRILLGGYVDRPESAYVVRLLEFAIATPQDQDELRHFRPFKGILDADLFLSFLRPGERSAIFGLQSPLAEYLPPGCEVCFFYLQV